MLQKWEYLDRKMEDFGNPKRLTLRCLGVGITPVSVKLKNTEHLKDTLLEKQKGNYEINVLGPSITLLN